MLGIKRLWVKDDGQNPTASLKDRASAMAVAKAMEAGAKTIACSSTGNAASSLAGNAAAAGIKTYIFVPERAPKGKVAQLMIFGANVISVKGNYEDTFKMSAAAIDKYGWYNRNAAINPYLSEGKKTVALEIAEQLNWEMPDYLAISVGDGCTIAGVWKGFKDLYAIGFIDKLPRLISAQSLGCYPINRAIQEDKPWEPMEENTIADSISVGVPRNADKALMAIRESNGIAVNVSDEEILAAQRLLGRTCGVFGEPAGVTGAAALKKALRAGRRSPTTPPWSVRGHRQRPEGRGQCHQVRRRAHSHRARPGSDGRGVQEARRHRGVKCSIPRQMHGICRGFSLANPSGMWYNSFHNTAHIAPREWRGRFYGAADGSAMGVSMQGASEHPFLFCLQEGTSP